MYGPGGELVFIGDLSTGGVLSYFHDVLYITIFVQLLGCWTDKAWWTFMLVRAAWRPRWEAGRVCRSGEGGGAQACPFLLQRHVLHLCVPPPPHSLTLAVVPDMMLRSPPQSFPSTFHLLECRSPRLLPTCWWCTWCCPGGTPPSSATAGPRQVRAAFCAHASAAVL